MKNVLFDCLMLDSLLPKTYATLICDNEPHTVKYSTILNYGVRSAPDRRESFRATVGSALARRVVGEKIYCK